jgi:hypothetical protein
MNREDTNREFGDLVYDVWRRGGNPDAVDRDNFDYPPHNGSYDFWTDDYKLKYELRKQGR